MKRVKNIKKLVIIRRCSQAFFLLFFVAILTPAGEPLAGTLLSRLLFRSSPLMMIRISLGIKAIAVGAGFGLIMLLLAMLFGRFFCGWICPMGTVIDYAGSLKKNRRIFTNKINGRISRVKFYVLGMFLILAFFRAQTAGIGDPLVGMARAVTLGVIPAVSMLYGTAHNYFTRLEIPLMIFVLILVISAVIPRLWCRALCPLGALYALMSRGALLRRVVVDCSDCDACSETCRMGAIKLKGEYVKTECVLCMDCVYSCPKHSVKFIWRREP